MATRNFRPDSLLGEGGFGCVFKGWIEENGTAPVKPGTGLTVAVKTLNHDGLQGHKEWLVWCPFHISIFTSYFLPLHFPYFLFLSNVLLLSVRSISSVIDIFQNLLCQAEVSFLGDLIHPNLVKLIGYCIEDDQRLLVYEFMSRGSLENHLFRSMFLLLFCCFLLWIVNYYLLVCV